MACYFVFADTLSIFFQVDCDESEYKEETNLSEELASLMCLTDDAESRSSNPNANPFSVAAVMVEKKVGGAGVLAQNFQNPFFPSLEKRFFFRNKPQKVIKMKEIFPDI